MDPSPSDVPVCYHLSAAYCFVADLVIQTFGASNYSGFTFTWPSFSLRRLVIATVNVEHRPIQLLTALFVLLMLGSHRTSTFSAASLHRPFSEHPSAQQTALPHHSLGTPPDNYSSIPAIKMKMRPPLIMKSRRTRGNVFICQTTTTTKTESASSLVVHLLAIAVPSLP
jgi:hypothetical protein